MDPINIWRSYGDHEYTNWTRFLEVLAWKAFERTPVRQRDLRQLDALVNRLQAPELRWLTMKGTPFYLELELTVGHHAGILRPSS